MNIDQYNWKDILNAIPDMISLLDEKHKILWLNDKMVQVLGVSRDQCIGEYCYKIVHDADEPPDYCPYTKFLKDSCRHSVEVFVDKLGKDYLVTVSPIKINEEKVEGSIHIARDISEIKSQQKELIVSKSKLFAAFNNSPVAMCITDIKSGLVLDVNLAWFNITGYNREEAINQYIQHLNIYIDLEARNRVVALLEEKGKVDNFDVVLKHRKGNIIYGQMSVSVINIDGRECGITAFVDRTEIVILEEAIRDTENIMLTEARENIVKSLEEGKLVR
jgi:PAS domain S-box-containing protein